MNLTTPEYKSVYKLREVNFSFYDNKAMLCNLDTTYLPLKHGFTIQEFLKKKLEIEESDLSIEEKVLLIYTALV